MIQELALAAGLGLLVGFQREWTSPHIAGIRTFTLITLFGTMNAFFIDSLGVWPVAAGLFAVTTLIITVYSFRFRDAAVKPGLTTPIAALVMYTSGVAVGLGKMELGVVVAGGTAVLLHWKVQLHTFVERLGKTEFRAIMQLALIALVILPILPNRAYDPFGVINPFEIWTMVVLIVGISLGSYIAYRFLGAKAGTILGGILGGLISSTATTVSHARRSRRAPESSSLGALVVMIASTIVFIRVLLEVTLVAPAILPHVAPPLVCMLLLMFLISAWLYRSRVGEAPPEPLDEDPAEIKAAILFGLLYAGVLFAVAAVKANFGTQGLYVVSAFSGLTDMDAITLSTAQMIKKESLEVGTGWRMILIGAMSNLVFKAGVVAVLGDRALLRHIAKSFGVALAGGGLLLAFWP